MSDHDTGVINVRFRFSTLEDFSMTAANWWIKHLIIGGVKYSRRIHAGEPEVEAVRNALAACIYRRMMIERDGHVWLIAHFGEEVYPLFEQLLHEHNLRGHWPAGLIMWLSYREDVARIEVRKSRTRHPNRPVHNKVIYERLIVEPHK